jgi:dolichol-phosphate mannosyltransferase
MPDRPISGSAAVHIAVIIPCFNVRRHIEDVIGRIGPEVTRVYVVDDKCPEESGHHVLANVHDRRVTVLFHEANQGVGGATLTGMQQAAADGAHVLVKLDGDGQIDPALIPQIVAPILAGEADYAKGNRFYFPAWVQPMPRTRLIGNALLSFLTKMSSGYWDIFDPTNGFVAIHAGVLGEISPEKVSRRFFFESDMLFRLNILQAVVRDVPMRAHYGDEVSNLRISRVISYFLLGHLKNTVKRIFYSYFLRDFGPGSLFLPMGILFVLFGAVFGTFAWIEAARANQAATTGTVMLATLPIITGVQFLLSFLAIDMGRIPRYPRQRQLRQAARVERLLATPTKWNGANQREADRNHL